MSANANPNVPDAEDRRSVLRRASDPDFVGIVASTLCAMHCFGVAVLAGISGAGALLEDERIELGFAVAAVTMALAGLARGARRHRSWKPAAVGTVGMISLAVAQCVPLDGAVAETALSVAGGALLAGAHLLNLRALRWMDACCARLA